MGVTNHLLTGMIFQVLGNIPWKSLHFSAFLTFPFSEDIGPGMTSITTAVLNLPRKSCWES